MNGKRDRILWYAFIFWKYRAIAWEVDKLRIKGEGTKIERTVPFRSVQLIDREPSLGIKEPFYHNKIVVTGSNDMRFQWFFYFILTPVHTKILCITFFDTLG